MPALEVKSPTMTSLTLVLDPASGADRASAVSRARRRRDEHGRYRRGVLRLPRRRRPQGSVHRGRPRRGRSHRPPHASTASSTTCRSTPRSSPARADRQATGARDDLVRRAVRRPLRRRAGDRDPARGTRRRPSPASAAIACARPARPSSATSAASRSPAAGGRARPAARPTRCTGGWSATPPNGARTCSSRSTFPTSTSGWRARSDALGIPVVYYISPQLWAWRPGRMKTMRAIADRVLVIFEFEKAIYETRDVPVEWVGHPLLDVMPPLRATGHVRAQRRARARAAGGRACCPEAAATSCGRSCRGWSTPRTADPAGSSRTCSSSSRARRTFTTICSRRSSRRVGAERSSSRARPTRARGGGCGDRRVGHGDRAGGAARVPDGRRVPVVAADLRAGPPLRPRRYIRDGQPGRRPASRAGTDPGRLHPAAVADHAIAIDP